MDNRVFLASVAARPTPSGRAIRLPTSRGELETFAIPLQTDWVPSGVLDRGRSREFFAAPHVIAADEQTIDWEATIAFREHLWSQGIGIAEAMDTAQRGMGLGWHDVGTLVRTTAGNAAGRPLVSGVGTDQLPADVVDLERIVDAYLEQLALVEDAGSTAVIMASRHLAAAARGPEDYLSVYQRIIEASRRPVILHWLGEAFDSALRGYWGPNDVDVAIDLVAALITAHSDRIDGIKISLLDAEKEVTLRALLPPGVRMYTGDDYNFPELIAGDGSRHSGALLGAFNPLAALAGTALDLFDAGDEEDARRVLDLGVPLSKIVFEAPTQFYKAGVAFLSWLDGHQERFVMLDRLEKQRSIDHYALVFRLAAEAGVLRDPELAEYRMRHLLVESGVDA